MLLVSFRDFFSYAGIDFKFYLFRLFVTNFQLLPRGTVRANICIAVDGFFTFIRFYSVACALQFSKVLSICFLRSHKTLVDIWQILVNIFEVLTDDIFFIDCSSCEIQEIFVEESLSSSLSEKIIRLEQMVLANEVLILFFS